MANACWLFVRGEESIWIERPYGTTLIVAGPRHRREERTFLTEDDVQRFQVSLAETLVAAGWFLWAFNEDRRDRDRAASRPATGERRGSGHVSLVIDRDRSPLAR